MLLHHLHSLWTPHCLGTFPHLFPEISLTQPSQHSSRSSFTWNFLEISWNFQSAPCICPSIPTCRLSFLPSFLPSTIFTQYSAYAEMMLDTRSLVGTAHLSRLKFTVEQERWLTRAKANSVWGVPRAVRTQESGSSSGGRVMGKEIFWVFLPCQGGSFSQGRPVLPSPPGTGDGPELVFQSSLWNPQN